MFSMSAARKKILDRPVELYIHFFDLMSQDLLKVVEESRVKGRVSGAINTTFIALIL